MATRDPLQSAIPAAWGMPPFPSEEAGRQVFERLSAFGHGLPQWRHHLGDGRVRLLAFRQTLGLIGMFRNTHVYRMEFEVTVEALEPVAAEQFYGDSRLLDTGEQLTERGTLTFELRVDGWCGEDGETYGPWSASQVSERWGTRFRRVQRLQIRQPAPRLSYCQNAPAAMA